MRPQTRFPFHKSPRFVKKLLSSDPPTPSSRKKAPFFKKTRALLSPIGALMSFSNLKSCCSIVRDRVQLSNNKTNRYKEDDAAFKRSSVGCVKLSPHNRCPCLLSNPLTRIMTNFKANLKFVASFQSTPDILLRPNLRGKLFFFFFFLMSEDFGQ